MNKIKYITKQVKNKSALDLGCVAHNLNLIKTQSKNNAWMHKIIKDYSKYVVGIDNEKKEIKILNNKGYNIIYKDVQDFNLEKKFEIIFAGEIIEHLANLSGFFNSIKLHMKRDSKLILTTPNCCRISNFLRILIKGKSVESKYHTLTFTAFLLNNLLIKEGFDNIKIYHSNSDYIQDKNWIYYIISLTRKEFKSNIIAECSHNYGKVTK